jgi:hypothetical protein
VGLGVFGWRRVPRGRQQLLLDETGGLSNLQLSQTTIPFCFRGRGFVRDRIASESDQPRGFNHQCSSTARSATGIELHCRRSSAERVPNSGLYPGIHSNQLAGNINSLLRDKIRDPAPLDLFPVDAVINYTALASAIVASRTLSARVNQPSSNFETNTSYDRSGDKIVKFSATAGTMKSRVPLASPRMRGGRGIGHIRPPRSYTVSWETGEDPAI